VNWFLIIGVALAGWTLLLILSSERQRRLLEIEARRQLALVELRKKQLEEQQNIPVLR
jgi:hypothetical protein